MDSVSNTSSDELLANIGGLDSDEMFQKMEFEAVQKKLKGKFQLTNNKNVVYIYYNVFVSLILR